MKKQVREGFLQSNSININFKTCKTKNILFRNIFLSGNNCKENKRIRNAKFRMGVTSSERVSDVIWEESRGEFKDTELSLILNCVISAGCLLFGYLKERERSNLQCVSVCKYVLYTCYMLAHLMC